MQGTIYKIVGVAFAEVEFQIDFIVFELFF